jgi:uracil phosphoribosyltransferase
VLATGGTMDAAIRLIQQEGGIVERVMLLNIVKKLNGMEKLKIEK